MVETLHAVAGRARFRVKELYGCDSMRKHLERSLAADPAVISAKANTLTSAILVRFNSGATRGRISSVIEEAVSEFNQSDQKDLSGSKWCKSWGGGLKRGNGCRGSDSRSPAGSEEYCPGPRSGKTLINRLKSTFSGRWMVQPEDPWHAIETHAVVAALGSSAEAGLSSEAAREKLAAYGPNHLPEPPRRTKLEILLNQLNSLPVALLGVAAGISLLTGGMADAVVIMVVVAINSSIGFVTENEAETTISSLKTLRNPSAVVVREGERKRIAAQNVVPGDLVILEPGTYVGADCRLLEATRLSVDESSLTGESIAVFKETPVLEGSDIPLADRKNICYMGTLVTGGQGLGVVVATGCYTQFGKLQAMIGETTAPQTPMEKQLNTVGNQLVLACGVVCGLVFVMGLMRRTGLTVILKTTISLAVAAVPEGLPTVATTTLALGIRKLSAQQVSVRDMEAVETLGEVQTICFDKTGTVTENRMSVTKIFSGNRTMELKSDGLFRGARKISVRNSPELVQLAKVCILCGELSGKEAEKGSSTEQALLEFAVRSGLSITEVSERYPRIRTKFRTEDRHFMATIHIAGTAKRFLAVKGNPVEVLAMCDTQLVGGQKLPISDLDISKIELENERMAGEALRVLGFACRSAGDEEVMERLSGLTWLGLIGMADPLRCGMRALIARFHNAGIVTIMLTGDQSPTAYAIGKALGLSRDDPLEILDSTSLTDIDPEALKGLSQRVHVFARVSPAHKLQIVRALQNAGKVVAMTGDGINDGPALKAADIGIAMGRGGTDVAREVADVVLQDDNLETMVLAVGYGRTIYDNIKKSLHFILSTNFSEIMVMFVAGAAGMGYPLGAMQLLWINLMSDIFPSLALALEAPEPGILDRPPRDPQEPIIRKSDFKRIGFEAGTISLAALGAYGVGLARYGIGQRASTLAFQSLTFAQLLHSISCRSEKVSIYDKEKLSPNRYLTLALGGSIGLQLLTFIVPWLRNFLGVSPIGLLDGAVIGISSILPLLVNEATKGIKFGPNSENNGRKR
ncbi:MAG: HAD-IC family P-type ATPase [Syntrophobacteraceae bacterium]